MLKNITVSNASLLAAPLAALALLAAPGGADAAKYVHYEGKTKEGMNIAFDVSKDRWIEHLYIQAPFSCGTTRHGMGRAGLKMSIWPPFRFRLGMHAKATEESGITRHYHLKTKGRRGGRIKGSFEQNWSQLGGGTSSADMQIQTCLATATFSLKPKKKRKG